jgi:hypothetical protein
MESLYSSEYEASFRDLDPSDPIDIVNAVSNLKIIYDELKNNFDIYSYESYNSVRKELIRRINFNIIQNRNNPEILNNYVQLLRYVQALDLDKIVCKKNNSCNILSTKRKSRKSRKVKVRKSSKRKSRKILRS